MRAQFSTSALCALTSLFLLTASLPLSPAPPAALNKRATYSVVPVDGGSSATGNGGLPVVTIVNTVTKVSPPTTKTIIETDTLPPVTKSSEATKTVLFSITASPATVTATAYSTISFKPSTVTVDISAVQNSTAISSSTHTSHISSPSVVPSYPATVTMPASSKISAVSSKPSSPSSPTLSIPTLPASISVPTYPASGISAPTTPLPSPSASASHTYDDGQWHTTYPPWRPTQS